MAEPVALLAEAGEPVQQHREQRRRMAAAGMQRAGRATGWGGWKPPP
jgi:hypothetical protein